MAKRLHTLAIWVVTLCLGVILLWLLTNSLLFTCTVVGLGDEKTLFLRDSVARQLLALVALLAAGVVCYTFRARILPVLSSKKMAAAVIVLWLCYTFYLLATQVSPVTDQKNCFEAAAAFLARDPSPWQRGGYAYIYPNQNGLILFFALIQKLFGVGNYLVVQFLNVLAAMAAAYFLVRFCQETALLQTTWFGMLILWLYAPMMFYITFNYGTTLGLACATASMYFQSVFLTRKTWYTLLLSAVLLVFAVEFKSNYLIFVVASVIVYLFYAICHRCWKNLVAILALILLSLLVNHAVSAVIQHRLGVEPGKGLPTMSWVLIGLGESSRAPGWHTNQALNILTSHDYNSEQASSEITEAVKERALYLMDNPKYAVKFFEKKVLSMWNEPTFQSIWIQQVKPHPYPYPRAISSLLSDDGTVHGWYESLFNYVQTWIYLFSLVYLLAFRRSASVRQLLPAIIMIGGFLFHLFWEAKSQYTVVYVFLLIPYACCGFRYSVRFLSKTLRRLAARRAPFHLPQH